MSFWQYATGRCMPLFYACPQSDFKWSLPFKNLFISQDILQAESPFTCTGDTRKYFEEVQIINMYQTHLYRLQWALTYHKFWSWLSPTSLRLTVPQPFLRLHPGLKIDNLPLEHGGISSMSRNVWTSPQTLSTWLHHPIFVCMNDFILCLCSRSKGWIKWSSERYCEKHERSVWEIPGLGIQNRIR